MVYRYILFTVVLTGICIFIIY